MELRRRKSMLTTGDALDWLRAEFPELLSQKVKSGRRCHFFLNYSFNDRKRDVRICIEPLGSRCKRAASLCVK